MAYHKEQTLNEWVSMLHSIYGLSQNYARTEYEILAHLSEVTGAFGKFLFKLKNPDRAKEFLPKMFGWAVALARKVKGERANLEDILLTKYPSVCPYCISAPCKCVPGQKEPINEAKVRAAFFNQAGAQRRSLNDFQAMFRKIYEHSWGLANTEAGSAEALGALQKIYIRIIEETSELGESVRFVHLYASNFDNELADYLAWVFALVSSLHKASAGNAAQFLVEDLLWPAYPGVCMVCMLDICDCRPSPVRELLSKPSLRDLQFVDGLTHANNRAKFDKDLVAVADRTLPLPQPMTCIQIDLDNFKNFNSPPFDHLTGDAALKHLVTVLRQKIRKRPILAVRMNEVFWEHCARDVVAPAQWLCYPEISAHQSVPLARCWIFTANALRRAKPGPPKPQRTITLLSAGFSYLERQVEIDVWLPRSSFCLLL